MRNSSEVFHAAHHSGRDSGRCGNVSYSGTIGKDSPRRLYSYSTCIGERFAGVCLLSERSYSNSTSKHIAGFRRASPVPVVVIGGRARGSGSLLGRSDYSAGWAEYVNGQVDMLAGLSPRMIRQRADRLARLASLVDGWGVFHAATGHRCGVELRRALRVARGVLDSQGATLADYVAKKQAAKKRAELKERRRMSAALASVGGLDGVRALFVREGRAAASAALDAVGLSWSSAFPSSMPDLLFVNPAGAGPVPAAETSQGVRVSLQTLNEYRDALRGASISSLTWGTPLRDDAAGVVCVGCHRFTVEHLRAVGVVS